MRLITLILASACLPLASAHACSVDAEPVAFGSIDLTQTSTGNGRITVNCPAAAVYALSIRSANDGADRIMTGTNGAQIRYRLYVDQGFIQQWGDGGVTGPSVGGNVAAGSVIDYTVFGRIPEQNLQPAGTYSDLPIITLLY